MFKSLIPLLLIVTFSHYVEPSRILAAIPTASLSHQLFYRNLWKELAKRGHEIVLITTDPMKEDIPNIQQISVNETYVPVKKLVDMMIKTNVFQLMLEDTAADLMHDFYSSQVNSPQIRKLVNNKNEHFDILIMEQPPSPLFGLKYRFKCPMIGVTSMDGMYPAHDLMGNADHAILYPALVNSLGANPTFLERLVAFLSDNWMKYLQDKTVLECDKYTKDVFGADVPSIAEIMEEIDMLFVNANPIFNAIRPHTPSTISIAGGMHMNPEQPLPKAIKDFLDNSKNGAIYFSLGSNVKSNYLTMELRQKFLDTLMQLPYNILWKFEEDLPEISKNVMIVKWAPQQDILRHKNIKMFITQAGLQSLEEALYSHIPVVLMPFFGDQEGNARRADEKGMGIFIDRHTLTVDSFIRVILEVINNPIYKETVIRLATQIQDTPMTTLQRAIWWIEYVIRHKGAKYLKGPRIPLYQYYYFDVLAVFGMALIMLIGASIVVLLFSCKKVGRIFKCKNPSNALKPKEKAH